MKMASSKMLRNPDPAMPRLSVLLLFAGLGGIFLAIKLFGLSLTLSGSEASTLFPHTAPKSENPKRAAIVGLETQAAAPATPIENATITGPYARQSRANDSTQKLLERLKLRRQKLDEREAALNAREKILEAQAGQVADGLIRLRQERARLEMIQQSFNETQTQNLEAVVSAYERMKPRDAAEVFDIMDDALLFRVAMRLRSQALSGIMAEMSPERARHLTTLLAEKQAGTEVAQ